MQISSFCPSHQFIHLSILSFVLWLCSYNSQSSPPPPIPIDWYFIYFFSFLQNSCKPEGTLNLFYVTVTAEYSKYLANDVIFLDRYFTLMSVGDWLFERNITAGMPCTLILQGSYSRWNSQYEGCLSQQSCYQGVNKCLFPMRTRKAMQRKRPT